MQLSSRGPFSAQRPAEVGLVGIASGVEEDTRYIDLVVVHIGLGTAHIGLARRRLAVDVEGVGSNFCHPY